MVHIDSLSACSFCQRRLDGYCVTPLLVTRSVFLIRSSPRFFTTFFLRAIILLLNTNEVFIARRTEVGRERQRIIENMNQSSFA